MKILTYQFGLPRGNIRNLIEVCVLPEICSVNAESD
jgi:hypothetical protein